MSETVIQEKESASNVVTVTANGPLVCSGALQVTSLDGTVVAEGSSLALCRCGASKNKPLCDGSHREVGFDHDGVWSDDKSVDELAEGAVHFKLAPNGPVLIEGPLEVRSADAEVRFAGERGALCRCGASATKPWCDGAHKAIGFEAD